MDSVGVAARFVGSAHQIVEWNVEQVGDRDQRFEFRVAFSMFIGYPLPFFEV